MKGPEEKNHVQGHQRHKHEAGKGNHPDLRRVDDNGQVGQRKKRRHYQHKHTGRYAEQPVLPLPFRHQSILLYNVLFFFQYQMSAKPKIRPPR